MSASTIREARARRKRRIRGRINGTTERPRVSVFRSNKAIYAQLVDDAAAATLVAARSAEIDGSGLKKAEVAKRVGELLAQRAKDKGIERVVFDRSGYLYHGRVKALAEGAREGGLVF
ncbi:MAG: 50S ribosomal protein L18 [Thermoleophilia bacterium]|jgi:large subunit ribosomal protein L18|nr:50S ribosomal protein L18 [Thermoleophilia bacterium]